MITIRNKIIPNETHDEVVKLTKDQVLLIKKSFRIEQKVLTSIDIVENDGLLTIIGVGYVDKETEVKEGE